MNLKYKKCKGGTIISLVLVVVALLLFTLAGVFKWSSSSYASAVNRTQNLRLVYAAEAGLEYALASFANMPHYNAHPKNEDCTTIVDSFNSQIKINDFPDDITVSDYSIGPEGEPWSGEIGSGEYKGMQGFVQSFLISITVNDRQGNQVSLSQKINSVFLSIFQFGVFYEHNLEMHPAPEMIFNGRVHCNSDIYVSAGNSIKFDSYVTTTKNIYHDRLEGSTPSNGGVYFKDDDDVYQSMKQDNIWLDSDLDYWSEEAWLRWGGNVRSKEHGTSYLSIPIPGVEDDSHVIVENTDDDDSSDLASAKYTNKARLKILKNKLYSSAGNGQPNVFISLLKDLDWIELKSSFWNARQGHKAMPIDIDLEKFNDWLEEEQPTSFTTDSECKGILYLSANDTAFDSFRIINGSEIPDSLDEGLTIASPNPIYIQGDYNKYNKRPCSFLADALTVLSENWTDVNYSRNFKVSTASATTVNAAMVIGNVETEENDSNSYSGGLENVIRFLENWKNKTFTYSGSIVCLWESTSEDECWKGYRNNSSYYYSAPKRNWSHDTTFRDPNTSPPGTPSIHTFEFAEWKREF